MTRGKLKKWLKVNNQYLIAVHFHCFYSLNFFIQCGFTTKTITTATVRGRRGLVVSAYAFGARGPRLKSRRSQRIIY